MNKPTPLGNVTIQVPEKWTAKERHEYLQATMQLLQQERAQRQRDREMYEKGRQDGRSIFTLFGF